MSNLKNLKDALSLLDEEKILRLNQALEETGNNVLRKEFAQHFKQILDFLKKLKAENQELVKSLKTDNKQEAQKLMKKNLKQMNRLEKQLIDRIESRANEEKEQLKKIKKENDSTFGGIRRRLFERVNSLFAKKQIDKKLSEIDEQIKEANLAPESIADKLETLTEEDRLKIEAIQGLEERLKSLEERPSGSMAGGGVSKMALEAKIVDNETPSGNIDGSNKTFELENKPNPPESVKVYVNGMKMKGGGEDYTLSGNTITFNTALPTGSNLLVDYRK